MRAWLPALLILVVVDGCQGGGAVSSPVVRVDLRSRLPEKVQRRLALADTSYECRRPFRLAAQGAEQAFVASWRVLEEASELHVIGVEVNPDGPTRGAGAPSASALVEETAKHKRGEQVISVTPVRVSWTASRGCGKLGATTRLELRADDPSCHKPRGPGRLLTPVR